MWAGTLIFCCFHGGGGMILVDDIGISGTSQLTSSESSHSSFWSSSPAWDMSDKYPWQTPSSESKLSTSASAPKSQSQGLRWLHCVALDLAVSISGVTNSFWVKKLWNLMACLLCQASEMFYHWVKIIITHLSHITLSNSSLLCSFWLISCFCQSNNPLYPSPCFTSAVFQSQDVLFCKRSSYGVGCVSVCSSWDCTASFSPTQCKWIGSLIDWFLHMFKASTLQLNVDSAINRSWLPWINVQAWSEEGLTCTQSCDCLIHCINNLVWSPLNFSFSS